MSLLRFERLAAIKTPLVNKFYNTHSARGRANKQDQVWVAYHGSDIIAACRIQHRGGHLFLSTLLVAPTWRRQQIAQQLLQFMLPEQQHKVYTFSYQSVAALYQTLGFVVTANLPEVLDTLLNCYKNRDVTAMAYEPSLLSVVSSEH